MTPTGYAFVSRRISAEQQPVRFMYREHPNQRDDSGWRFFAGDETDEYANNPDNITINALSTVIQFDPEIERHLEAPYGSAFERSTSKEAFVRSDWQIPAEDQT